MYSAHELSPLTPPKESTERPSQSQSALEGEMMSDLATTTAYLTLLLLLLNALQQCTPLPLSPMPLSPILYAVSYIA